MVTCRHVSKLAGSGHEVQYLVCYSNPLHSIFYCMPPLPLASFQGLSIELFFFLSAMVFLNCSQWEQSTCGSTWWPREKLLHPASFFRALCLFLRGCSEQFQLKTTKLFRNALVSSRSLLFRQPIICEMGMTRHLSPQTPRKWRRSLFWLCLSIPSIITEAEKPICQRADWLDTECSWWIYHPTLCTTRGLLFPAINPTLT